MATDTVAWILVSSIFLVIIPGVLCDDDYNIGGLVAAAGVAFILLAVVIAVIVAGLTWNSWYPQLQWAKGRVKMPRAYWRKREEAKLRLLHGSRSGLASLAAPSESGLPNGHNSSRVRDTEENKSDKASWVQGWNNANSMEETGYEEMALAMELGEERDEEVRIETTVVDNEALDLGPFKDAGVGTATPAANPPTTPVGGDAGAVGGDAENSGRLLSMAPTTTEMTEAPDDSYVYSTVDRSAKRSATAMSTSRVGDEAASGGAEGPAATSEKVTSFSKMDPYLVAL